MSWNDPTTPNLGDYASFLASVVGIPPVMPPGAASVFPTVSSLATDGTTSSLTDTTQTWTQNQWNGCTLLDSTANLCAVITGTSPNQVTFAALTQAPAAGDAYIIVQPIVPVSLGIAMRTVNCALNAVDSAIYTLAVYNLAADRLINFAPDQKGQTFFADLRTKTFKISSFTPGVVSSTSDKSTSTALLNSEFMERMTLRDLQNLKTPYGRAYLEMAMDYGPNIWSLV